MTDQNPSPLIKKLAHISGQARMGEMSDEDGLRDTLPFGMVEQMCDAIEEAAAALAAHEAEVERLKKYADTLSRLDRESRCLCFDIEQADIRASAVDGTASPTAESMTPEQLQACLSFIWDNFGAAPANAATLDQEASDV
ncbi:MAG: hypothetical protein AAGF47_07050 [Planctomycetota bacterium]